MRVDTGYPLCCGGLVERLNGGNKVDQLVAHYDVLPTLVDLLGSRFQSRKSPGWKKF